jgi:hypothetical protein
MAGKHICFLSRAKRGYVAEFELAQPMCYRWLIDYPKDVKPPTKDERYGGIHG